MKRKKIFSYQNPFLNFKIHQRSKENAYATMWCVELHPPLKKKQNSTMSILGTKFMYLSQTFIYKGKMINSGDLSIIFSLLVLLLFWYVNILYWKINLPSKYIIFFLNIRTKNFNMNCAISSVTNTCTCICFLIFLAGGECVVVY